MIKSKANNFHLGYFIAFDLMQVFCKKGELRYQFANYFTYFQQGSSQNPNEKPHRHVFYSLLVLIKITLNI